MNPEIHGERDHSPETYVPTRDEVIHALREIRQLDESYTTPDALPTDDPQVTAARDLFKAWNDNARLEAHASQDKEAVLAHQLSRDTVFIEAGFIDKRYVLEVANDWLYHDEQDALARDLKNIASTIHSKRRQLNRLIGLLGLPDKRI